MSKLALRRRSRRSLLPDLSNLLPDFPAGFRLRQNHFIRIEDQMEDGRYVVRAEIPGIDPAKDVDITVRDGQLTIKAERTVKSESKGTSEFSYGSFARSVPLPSGANEDDVTATYRKGILTVSVGASKVAPAEKHIAVQAANE
ncbi:Hsp20/alpha crystallin family protein [Mycobacterium haemophilum]|uniref:Antigen n=1 Tax=Mycobacterium haemophilum TaxID=29311 RepID=A0A0I9TY38_9MYCO|nr:Hsp20/alpha crystallin family protein [Mycobacterium haemophilum]KLO33525.1 antigen [Mycobacterium haemophilum]KLO39052.1 antigen [Mycobacterium haemophilum]KLO45466.1 antigen [Mycobacterium haemophilum]KLO56618.1 antigen [Mycobacterium haemophilum]